MTINQDFFFGDGEINQMPFDYDNLNNFDTSQDWTLPNEAFQPRHEILYPSAMPPQEYHSKCSPREIQESGKLFLFCVPCFSKYFMSLDHKVIFFIY